MTKHLLKTLAGASALLASSAFAAPAIIFDLGGKFDKSFNEAAYNGAEAYKAASGENYAEFEVTNEGQRELALTKMAQRGYSPIVVVGFGFASSLEKIADEYPDSQFGIIDMVVDKPNVRSVVFKEQEGSFLVGALAALASKNNSVGFVGGMDIPLIRRFSCGYAQGAKHVNAEVKVLENMTGTTPAAWNDPTKGGELARSQFDRGADVVFAAAGNTGVGVYQAAVDNKKLAIGVDSNQNHLHPGSMLTSMVKRVDLAVESIFSEAKAGKFSSGIQVLGLAEGGVDWALDEHNRGLVSEEMEQQINAIAAKIKAGDIQVHDYMSNSKCGE